MTDHQEIKATLAARLVVLQRRLSGIEAELDTPRAQDWEEAATEREGDEVLEGIGLSGQSEMRRIKAALGRIDDGLYGLCADCGAEIGADRLKAVPEAVVCRDCIAT